MDSEDPAEPTPHPTHPAAERESWADVVPLRRTERPPALRELIGEVLREERHRQERTLADVAEEAAVSLQYLSEVERGVKDVSSDLLSAMHEALGLDLAEVLERVSRRLEVRAQGRHWFRMLAA